MICFLLYEHVSFFFKKGKEIGAHGKNVREFHLSCPRHQLTMHASFINMSNMI